MERIRSIVLGLSLLGFLAVATSRMDGGEVCINNNYSCSQCSSTMNYYWCDNPTLPGTGGFCGSVSGDTPGCTNGTHQCGTKLDCQWNIDMGPCSSVAFCNNNP